MALEALIALRPLAQQRWRLPALQNLGQSQWSTANTPHVGFRGVTKGAQHNLRGSCLDWEFGLIWLVEEEGGDVAPSPSITAKGKRFLRSDHFLTSAWSAQSSRVEQRPLNHSRPLEQEV